ncbi:chorismate mutase [Eggerthellaceae bacterium zg-1084]|uniref:chorismate mutase n=1 Tax=Berryella wangjianweii TaxID=2734634 RepID=UPI00155817F4|nr:chorismate mutase [Berryella wangjianweii]NPD30375.1 chorismate mutase [Berryella wangjianweii]
MQVTDAFTNGEAERLGARIADGAAHAVAAGAPQATCPAAAPVPASGGDVAADVDALDEVPEDIRRHRARIDELDAQIARLLNERCAHSHAIRSLKRREGLGLFDARREEQIYERVGAEAGTEGPLAFEHLRAIYATILRVMRES